jgi:hypothetical protein
VIVRNTLLHSNDWRRFGLCLKHLYQPPPGVDARSKAEQVRYLQGLWDQISEDPSTVPVPESHLRLAEERLKRHHQDLLRAHSAFEVLARLADTSSTDSESE